METIHCSEMDVLIPPFLHGRYDTLDKNKVLLHLSQCCRCRNELAMAARLVGQMKKELEDCALIPEVRRPRERKIHCTTLLQEMIIDTTRGVAESVLERMLIVSGIQSYLKGV